MVDVVVRYVNGLKDTVLSGLGDRDIRDVSTVLIRQEIRKMYPELKLKKLRLLHNGRVLQNHIDLSKELKYFSRAGDHTEGEAGDDAVTREQEPIKFYIHCIVGEEELSLKEIEIEENLDRQPVKSTTEAPSGFDRLLSQGFSQSDIENLRRQFFRIHQNTLPSNATAQQIRQLEDRWIDSSVNHEIDEFPMNLNTTNTDSVNVDNDATTADAAANNNNAATVRNRMIQRDTAFHRDMLVGVTVGFSLGGLALLLLLLDIGGVFSKRNKLAVVSGVVVNLSFGVLRTWGQ